MRVATRNPVMRPAAAAATLVGTTSRVGSGLVSWPGGTAAGDLAIIYSSFGTFTAQAGWTNIDVVWISFGYHSQICWKVLSAGDVSTPPTTAGSFEDVHVMVFRGATTVTQKIMTNGATAADNIGSFAPSGSTKGTVVFADDRSQTVQNITSPASTFTRYINETLGSFFSVMACFGLYTGGSIIWGSVVSGTDRMYTALELT